MARVTRLAAWMVIVIAVAVVPAWGQWKLDLPEGGVGFRFGNVIIEPLKNVQAKAVYSDEAGMGFLDVTDLRQAGGQWPDPLTGNFVGNLSGKEIAFQAKVPNGQYLVWLAAGPIIRGDQKERRYLLKLNDKILADDKPSDEEFGSEKYLYRFLFTQYSEKPHALWENYISRMYPAAVQEITVTDGLIKVVAANHFLSALIAVPAGKKAEFEKLAAAIRDKRISLFEESLKPPPTKLAVDKAPAQPGTPPAPFPPPKPEKQPGDGDAIVYVPADPIAIQPWSGPSAEERKATKVATGAAQGQKTVIVLAVTPFADLGKCTLELADLIGPGVIPAANVTGYYKNYRFNGKDYRDNGRNKPKTMDEMCLIPTLTLDLEKGVAFSYWLRLSVAEDAKPGLYKATWTLKGEKGALASVPVKLEVYPFKLESVLPVSYGFWGTVGDIPKYLSDDAKKRITRDRLASMVDLGLTATCVDVFSVKALNPDGTVVLNNNDPDFCKLVKEAGMGRHPEQAQLIGNIMASAGRQIAAKMPGGGGIWNNPGLEFKLPGFENYFQDAVRQYRDYFKGLGLPVLFTSVDEPRERAINSWNRNYVDTIKYCDMLHEVGGIRVCCNPMYDVTHGKDYTPMIDHVDVLSTHAWKNSEKFMKQTLEKKKTLWLYNCGRDRYSYGFYNWRWKSNGRWEWQFMEAGNDAVGGYPGREWYNPFTGLHSGSNCAPLKYKGGLLYQAHFLHMSEGINDEAYLITLENLLKTASGPKAQEARDYLAALERAMPEFPQIKGLASATDGPRVGMGIEDDARLKCDEWRKAVAGLIKELKE